MIHGNTAGIKPMLKMITDTFLSKGNTRTKVLDLFNIWLLLRNELLVSNE